MQTGQCREGPTSSLSPWQAVQALSLFLCQWPHGNVAMVTQTHDWGLVRLHEVVCKWSPCRVAERVEIRMLLTWEMCVLEPICSGSPSVKVLLWTFWSRKKPQMFLPMVSKLNLSIYEGISSFDPLLHLAFVYLVLFLFWRWTHCIYSPG